MKNENLEEIKIKSVQYYENNWMSPDFKMQTTRESVIDCSGYFYAYAVKLIQNNLYKTKYEAEQSFPDLLTQMEESLTESLKMSIISDYNNVYSMLLDNFKKGIDYGEESMEGFKIMLDASGKIITSSIYWLENN